MLSGLFWFVSESLRKFVRVSKITMTYIFVRGITNINITWTFTKCYWLATRTKHFILFLYTFVFGVLVQLENKRLPFSCNITNTLIPIEICVPAECSSVFGFNQKNCGSFIITSRVKITGFKSIPIGFIE
jgi:uncharacterized membrane protein